MQRCPEGKESEFCRDTERATLQTTVSGGCAGCNPATVRFGERGTDALSGRVTSSGYGWGKDWWVSQGGWGWRQ